MDLQRQVEVHGRAACAADQRDRTDTFVLIGPTATGASCAAIRAANPSAPDGAYVIDPDGAGGHAPVTTYCDMTGGGWTLVANSWIPSYQSRMPAKYTAVGKFVLPHDLGLSFNQVKLQCTSNTTTIDRTRAFGSTSTDLDTVGSTATETYGATDNLSKPSSTACFLGYSEWHGLNGGCGNRFIVRTGEIHCGLDYTAVGGANDNPALGKSGQIWAR